MFERFTPAARQVVVEAQQKAVAQNAPEITPMHVLLALLTEPANEAGRLLARLGVSVQDVVREAAAEVERVRRRGGITEADVRALDELGIDVDQIIDRLEQTHGPNPFATAQPVRGKRGHLPFADDSKKSLELSVREVAEMGGRELGPEHILLALAVLRGPAADVLARFEIDAPRLRRALAAPGD